MARIAIDIDGVLANFIESFAKVANNIWPGRLPADFEPNDWNFGELSKDELRGIWQHIKATPNFWLHLKPYPQSMRALAKFLMTVDKQDIYFCTARVATIGATPAMQTTQWLNMWELQGGGNHLSTIVVEEANAKVDVYAALDIQYSLDDRGDTVKQCEGLVGHHAMLLDRPWNQGYDVTRVYDAEEFFSAIRNAERNK